MATLTQTIDLSLAWVGSGENELWGTMLWGSGFWGEGSIHWHMDKGVAISVAPTMAVGKSLHHLVDLGDIAPTSTVGKRPKKVFANSFAATGANAAENLMSGIYDYVFISDTVNGQDRAFTTWAAGSASSSSYTSGSVTATNWSSAT